MKRRNEPALGSLMKSIARKSRRVGQPSLSQFVELSLATGLGAWALKMSDEALQEGRPNAAEDFHNAAVSSLADADDMLTALLRTP